MSAIGEWMGALTGALQQKLNVALVQRDTARQQVENLRASRDEYRSKWEDAQREGRYLLSEATERNKRLSYDNARLAQSNQALSARLADLQAKQNDAGAKAFERIRNDALREASLSHLEHVIGALALSQYGVGFDSALKAYNAQTPSKERAVRKHEAFAYAYGGHAGEGGLQRHSVGEEYPFVVYGEEYHGKVRYRILDSRSGYTYWGKFDTSLRASIVVKRLKSQGRRVITATGKLSPL